MLPLGSAVLIAAKWVLRSDSAMWNKPDQGTTLISVANQAQTMALNQEVCSGTAVLGLQEGLLFVSCKDLLLRRHFWCFRLSLAGVPQSQSAAVPTCLPYIGAGLLLQCNLNCSWHKKVFTPVIRVFLFMLGHHTLPFTLLTMFVLARG